MSRLSGECNIAEFALKYAHFDLGLESGRWQVIWFGRLAPLPATPITSGVYTFLRQLDAGRRHPVIVAKVVSLSHIALLPIGTVLDGDTNLILQMRPPSKRTRRRTLELDLRAENTELARRSEIAAVGPAGEWAGDARYDGSLIRVAETTSHPQVYIPCAVLFQFFWGVTSTLTNALLAGELEDPKQFIYNPHETTLNTDPVRVQIRNKWTDEEAPYLVALLKEPNALERGCWVFRRIAAAGNAGPVEMNSPAMQLEVWPPFARAMRIEGMFHEVPSQRPGASSYLVLTHILSADMQPDWTSLLLFRETGRHGPHAGVPAGTPASAPAEARDEGRTGIPKPGSKLEVQETPGGYSGTDELPLLSPLKQRFPSLAALEVQRPVTNEPGPSKRRRRPKVLRGPWSAIPGTPQRTGAIRNGKLVGAAEIEPQLDRPTDEKVTHHEPVDEQLLEFRELFLVRVKELSLSGGGTVTKIGFFNPFDEQWVEHSPRYFKLPDRVAGEALTWLYRDPACLHTKRGLCVRIQVIYPSGQCASRYIVELERRVPQHRIPTAERKPVRSGLLVVWFDAETDQATTCLRIRQVLMRAALARTLAIKHRPAQGVNIATLRHGAANLQQLLGRVFAADDQCEAAHHTVPAAT